MDNMEKEVNELLTKFVTENGCSDVDIFKSFVKDLKKFHLEEMHCGECQNPHINDITATLAEVSLSENSRTSLRKSRRSVCVVKNLISSDEDDEEENDNRESSGDEVDDDESPNNAEDENRSKVSLTADLYVKADDKINSPSSLCMNSGRRHLYTSCNVEKDSVQSEGHPDDDLQQSLIELTDAATSIIVIDSENNASVQSEGRPEDDLQQSFIELTDAATSIIVTDSENHGADVHDITPDGLFEWEDELSSLQPSNDCSNSGDYYKSRKVNDASVSFMVNNTGLSDESTGSIENNHEASAIATSQSNVSFQNNDLTDRLVDVHNVSASSNCGINFNSLLANDAGVSKNCSSQNERATLVSKDIKSRIILIDYPYSDSEDESDNDAEDKKFSSTPMDTYTSQSNVSFQNNDLTDRLVDVHNVSASSNCGINFNSLLTNDTGVSKNCSLQNERATMASKDIKSRIVLIDYPYSDSDDESGNGGEDEKSSSTPVDRRTTSGNISIEGNLSPSNLSGCATNCVATLFKTPSIKSQSVKAEVDIRSNVSALSEMVEEEKKKIEKEEVVDEGEEDNVKGDENNSANCSKSSSDDQISYSRAKSSDEDRSNTDDDEEHFFQFLSSVSKRKQVILSSDSGDDNFIDDVSVLSENVQASSKVQSEPKSIGRSTVSDNINKSVLNIDIVDAENDVLPKERKRMEEDEASVQTNDMSLENSGKEDESTSSSSSSVEEFFMDLKKFKKELEPETEMFDDIADSLKSLELHEKIKSNINDEAFIQCGTPKPGCSRPIFSTPRSAVNDVFSRYQTKAAPGTPAYKRAFNRTKDQVVNDLYLLFNKTIFDGKLPNDMEITWNKRMTKTAGVCYYSISMGKRVSRIELSDKVADNTSRIRDTLVHELCHAAVWLIDGKKGGHGHDWKYWALRSNKAHPDLPIISRCHQYEINTKYTYKCNGCGITIGRHSKSIDKKRHCCARCGGIPELVVDASNKKLNTPSKYSLFLKQHFSAIKKNRPGLSHKELMQEISKQYNECK